MDDATQKAEDQTLLEATLAYVANHRDNRIDGFREPVANWGTIWRGVAPAHLPASDILAQSRERGLPETRDLMDYFIRARDSRHWEQTYTRADSLIGDDMLETYGFAEIIGKRGPFVSERVRAGVGVYGQGIDYPPHRHKAEEIYIILAGSADFKLGNGDPVRREAGDLVHVPSYLVHGYRMTDEPLIVFYLWKDGDLREKSTFV